MSVVHLNVGGQQFSTTLTTISHDPDSMLAKMVNDCWDLKKINSGQVSLPEESEKVNELYFFSVWCCYSTFNTCT